MALAGIQVEFGFLGAVGQEGNVQNVLGAPVSSENLAAPGTTAIIAPTGRDGNFNAGGQPVARVFAVADSYVAFGAVPNASASPRALVKAGTEITRGVKPGDKVAYIVVP